MSVFPKIKELVATYKVIAGGITAILCISSIIGVGYVYV